MISNPVISGRDGTQDCIADVWGADNTTVWIVRINTLVRTQKGS